MCIRDRLRPFALGLCIMFFPTFVLGTINTVLSPVVKGCNQLMETQTFDMNEYRAQKDRLEYEALMRSPETAYLASDEEFDRQLEELGWSPSDMVTMKMCIRDSFRTWKICPERSGRTADLRNCPLTGAIAG